MARTLQRQLLDAFNKRDITFGELRRLANLRCSEDSVSRKLRGKQVMFTREAEAIANALRVEVRYPAKAGKSEAAKTVGIAKSNVRVIELRARRRGLLAGIETRVEPDSPWAVT